VTVNAIKATALTCRHPLRGFLKTIEHYGSSLELAYSAGLMRVTKNKLRWRETRKAQVVERLQAQLVGYVGSINMLMGLYKMFILIGRYNVLAAKALDTSLGSLAIAAQDSRETSNEIRNEVRDSRASLSQEDMVALEKSSTILQTLQTSFASMFSGITGTIGDLKQARLKS
jgi:hypothetical protein